MADVEDIIYYLKSLKRGFDKTLFQSKIDELAYVVDSVGIEYEHFHTLFKVWLNLSIPITKWTSMGACLVPKEGVQERTVEYALRWLLATQGVQSDFPKIKFLLDWLTAAMDSDCVDKTALDGGYEIFYTMLTYEILTANAIKLVYTLTKPVDVTRRRVVEMLDLAKKREGKKTWLRQLQVLLGLYKSYKPECVPENIPAICVHTSFKKINETLVERFKKCQEFRSVQNKEAQHLMWTIPSNLGTRNRKADPLVPNLEFFNIGSKQYEDKEIPEKNYLDFSDPVSLVHYSLHHAVCRPARLRALLTNSTGITLLAVANPDDHAFLSHDLQHCFATCFLDASPHSYTEKSDFLRRLCALQRTLCQALPVVTRFLVQYLPVWNEADYFAEILELVEWTSVECPEHVIYIMDALTRVYHRSSPLERCAILNSLTTMYCNLVYASKRGRRHFPDAGAGADWPRALQRVADTIAEMCHKAIQVDPDDLRIIHSNLTSCQLMCYAEARYATSIGSLPGTLALAVPLLSVSSALLDKIADLMILYKKIYKIMKIKNIPKANQHNTQIQTLRAYSTDLMNCLHSEEALTNRNSGLVFTRMHPQIVDKLGSLIPNADAMFSIRNNLAFAPYTYIQLEDVNFSDADNRMVLDLLGQEFSSLGTFISKIAQVN